MPTIVEERGFRVMIYMNDHEPPHVHVWKAGVEASIFLNPVSLRHSDMRSNDTKRAVKIVERNQAVLQTAWNRIHGDDNE